jgi:tRNA A37 threonylcarbamoyladenosine synthetase subunit TsaC/SUA5/YrdC
MTTSANTPKSPTSRTIDEAIAYFGDEIDFYVDAGDLGARPPSTIVAFEGNRLIVHREGAFDSRLLQ